MLRFSSDGTPSAFAIQGKAHYHLRAERFSNLLWEFWTCYEWRLRRSSLVGGHTSHL